MTNQDLFKNHGFCIIKNAISNDVRDIITQYALFDEMQNYNPEGDTGGICVPNAHSKYADPVMESVLLHLQESIEENVGFKVDPTYSYYRVYRKGDDLKPHQDRPSCEIHYIDQNGPHTSHKFDGRETIGISETNESTSTTQPQTPIPNEKSYIQWS